ncbi:MAG: hypothetical protein H6623_03980 [Bdellovibrionaceae bacterium]|nr:hypothetical protein [Pseudobdellovibrionaceae bacterium]
MKLKYLLLAGVTLIFSCMACNRAKNEVSSVTFVVPSVESKAVSISSATDVQGDAGDDEGNGGGGWSLVAPTGLEASGGAPINCYAVMVGGPEANFSENYCGRSKSDGTMDKMFSFGPWAGAVYAGVNEGRVKLEIPSGKDRVIRLIGFYALTPEACSDFKVREPQQGMLSKPHILGEVGHVLLDPGKDIEIKVTRTFDPNQWFDDCKFKDSLKEQDKVPTKVALNKPFDFFPGIVGGSCVPLVISLVNDGGKRASSTSLQTVQMKYCAGNGSDCYDGVNLPSNVLPSYAYAAECIADSGGTSGMTSFGINAGDSQVYRWVRSAAGPSANDHMFIYASAQQLSAGEVVRYALATSISSSGLLVMGPNVAVKNQCYKYTVESKTFSGSVGTGTTGSIDTFDVLKKENGSEVVKATVGGTNSLIFSDSACGTALTSLSMSTSASSFYAKFPEDGAYYLKLDKSGNVGSKYRVSSLSAASDLYKIKAYGQRIQSGTTSTCHGPYVVRLQDHYGADVLNTNAEGVVRNIYLTNAAQLNDVEVYPDYTSCATLSGKVSATSNPLNINLNESFATFYIRNTGSVGGEREFKFQSYKNDTAEDFSDSFKIQFY